jgi:4-aminobutyrate aminotransferase-like enzyme
VSKTKHVLALLEAFESRNITFIDPDGSWPVVWERAQGVHVWDAEGKRYLDLTAAFGVAAAGHANRRVVQAGQNQMSRLLHAMGDVHPHELKAALSRELSRLTFERWGRQASRLGKGTLRPSLPRGKTIFCNSGFEAVEAALKTALLASGKPGVIGFEGGYHGLGYGALNLTHRALFRRPFLPQLGAFGHFVPFPQTVRDLGPMEDSLRRLFHRHRIGAVLVEPVQGRGGIRVPPAPFLRRLRRLCDEHQALLVLDEIYTGFGRTGRWFACEHGGVIPDLICLGKALAGGFPLSACVGRADLMDAAWPESKGEAVHTSTFLGHPVGCAMALAQIEELRRKDLVRRSDRLGRYLRNELASLRPPSSILLGVRGLGLMVGLEFRRRRDGTPAGLEAWAVVKGMLRRGFILLPEGEQGQVLGFTPSLTVTEPQLRRCARVLAQVLSEVEPG